MNAGIDQTRGASPFGRGTAFAVVFAGFLAFVAMLYFIGAGDTGGRGDKGEAHAASTGLNGYAGLVRLLRAEGHSVTLSREPGGLETEDLLVLTPPANAEADEIAQILETREYLGPTLVILPKWIASPPPDRLEEEVADKFKDGWVQLTGAGATGWTEQLPAPYTATHAFEALEDGQDRGFSGLEVSGELPSAAIGYAKESPGLGALITDAAGHRLAYSVRGEEGSDYYEDAHWTIFVAEPDLMNNFGLADPARAKAALALVREAGYGGEYAITFDLTLNGFGGAMNLLTLAFQPPFLAATLCLLLAMMIVCWRAFARFGPALAPVREIAFGKEQLVTNGAGLIVRAKRLRLLTRPYAALSEKRLAARLGLTRHDPETIDAALVTRLPQEEPFSKRAQRLRDAQSATEILRAARALRELEGKLTR